MGNWFLIFLLFYAVSWAQADQTVENMAQLAERVRSAKSIDEALALLPKSLTQNATLGKCSQGLQQASPNYPRAFLYEGTGKFVVSFNGHPSQKAFNEIETIEFDPQKKEWRLARLKFDSKGAPKTEYNPPQCLKCHGNPPQPIWGQYRNWPCLFGEDDDVVSDGSDLEEKYKSLMSPEDYEKRVSERKKENKQFLAFLELVKKDLKSRYRILSFKNDESTNGLYRRHSDSLVNPFPRPNTNLTELLGRRQAQGIAGSIQEHPNYQKWKNSVAYLLLGCLPSSDSSKASLLEDIFPTSSTSKYRLGYSQAPTSGETPKIPRDSIARESIQRLLNSFGVEKRRWNLEFTNSSEYYYLGSITIEEGVRGLLLKDTFQSNPELAPFFVGDSDYLYQDPNDIQKDYYTKLHDKYPSLLEREKILALMVGGHNRKKIQESCTTLEKFVDQEILANGASFGLHPNFYRCQYDSQKNSYPESAQIEAILQVVQSEQMKEMVKQATNPWPTVVDSCIRCHEGGDRVGPLIYFSDPRKLLEQNASFESKYGFGDLFGAIEMATDPNFHEPARRGGTLMPFGGEALTADERKILMEYLRSAKPKK